LKAEPTRPRALAALALAALLPWSAGFAATTPAPSCRTLAASADPVATVEMTLAGVPALLRVPKTVTRPPIVLWHGFGAPASEQALMDLLPLDDVPAVKVYLGLPLFGKRAEAGGVEALKRRQASDFATQIFAPVVVGAAEELPAAVKALRAMGCVARGEKIGLFGFSGGGAAALLALAEHEVPVGRAVVLNASTGLSASIGAFEKATGKPYAWSEAARALARRTDAAGRAGEIAAGHPPVALLIVQGTADAMLDPQLAVALQAALKPKYAARDAQRLQLILADDLPHNVSDAGRIAQLRTWTADWFNR
jgi:predicted esterase